MQVYPIKTTLKAPGTQRLKQKYDYVLSSFAFNLNLRHYDVATTWRGVTSDMSDVKELIPEFFYLPEMFQNVNGRGLHSFTLELNLSNSRTRS